MGTLKLSVLPESFAKFQQLKGRTSFIIYLKLENNTSSPVSISLPEFSVKANDKELLLIQRANHADRKIIGKDNRPAVVYLDLIQITSNGQIPEKQIPPGKSVQLTLMAHYRDNNFRFPKDTTLTVKFQDISASSTIAVF